MKMLNIVNKILLSKANLMIFELFGYKRLVLHKF